MQTIRIYFEYGTKAEGLSRWQRVWNNRLANRLMKMCKEAGLQQAIFFNVEVGYLNSQAIQWGISEIIPPRKPQCLEITDTAASIDAFLKTTGQLLKNARIIAVEKQEIIELSNL